MRYAILSIKQLLYCIVLGQAEHYLSASHTPLLPVL